MNIANVPKYLLLLIFPVLFGSIAFAVKKGQGPYYLGSNSDPAYMYVINALNLARLKAPGHTDNPGTVQQVIGGGVFRVTYLLTGREKNITEDVLRRPEHYLDILNAVAVGANILALLVFGFWVFSFTGEWGTALLFQGSHFFSYITYYSLNRVSPEAWLNIFSLGIGVLLLRLLYLNDYQARKRYYVTGFAVLVALGAASKSNFIPVGILPLIVLRPWSLRLRYMGLTMLLFALFVAPALLASDHFFLWTRDLIFRSGYYGTGEATVVDRNTFFPNLKSIWVLEWPLTLVVCLLGGLLLAGRFNGRAARFFRAQPVAGGVLGGLFALFLVQALVVAKHYNEHYMIPVLLLGTTAGIGIVYVSRQLLAKSLHPAVIAVAVGGWAAGMYYQGNRLQSFYRHVVYERVIQEETLKVMNRQAGNALRVVHYGDISPQYALFFGLQYAGKQKQHYGGILARRFPRYLYYNGGFYSWEGQTVPFGATEETARTPVLFQGPNTEGKPAAFEFSRDNVPYEAVVTQLYRDSRGIGIDRLVRVQEKKP